MWYDDPVLQDCVDAIMLYLYKDKGSKSNCDNYRGISLLEAVGKVLPKVLSSRLVKLICPRVIPESQCVFRMGRGTVDMIFFTHLLIERCIEYRVLLYQYLLT